MSAVLSEVGAKQYLPDISKKALTYVSLRHNTENSQSLVFDLTLKVSMIEEQ